MTFAALIAVWRKFWFEPQDASPVALYRILYGILILQIAVVHLGENFSQWYGPNAVMTLSAVIKHFWLNEPRFDMLLLLPQTEGAFAAFHLVFVMVAVALTVGFCSRYSVLFVWLTLLSMHHHDPFNINGGDAFLRAVGPWLALSHCGDKFSVDSLIRRKKGLPEPDPSAPWAQRMIQVQLAIVYWQTFCCKIGGTQWLDGSAIYYATRLDDMFRFPAPIISNNIYLLKALNWFTLVIEFAGWTVIWFKESCYYVLIGLFCLHLGIDYMINLPVFEWAFIFTLVTFIRPEDLNYVLHRVKKLSLKSVRNAGAIT